MRKYSLSPSRYSRRVTWISEKFKYLAGTRPSSVENTSDTSAIPSGFLDSLPPKMTSSMLLPRRFLADCSPITQRMASTTFDFPQPFGPTIAVIPSGKSKTTLSTKDLKPIISSLFIFINRYIVAERLVLCKTKMEPVQLWQSVEDPGLASCHGGLYTEPFIQLRCGKV